MTYNEIYALIESIGIPSAYYQFKKNTAVPPPFICFYFEGTDNYIADGTVYQKIEDLIVELYTEDKDFELEARVETALTGADLVWQREEDYIGSEEMFMVTYTTSVIIDT